MGQTGVGSSGARAWGARSWSRSSGKPVFSREHFYLKKMTLLLGRKWIREKEEWEPCYEIAALVRQ